MGRAGAQAPQDHLLETRFTSTKLIDCAGNVKLVVFRARLFSFAFAFPSSAETQYGKACSRKLARLHYIPAVGTAATPTSQHDHPSPARYSRAMNNTNQLTSITVKVNRSLT